MKYFDYGEKELNYLKSKDKVLGEVIDQIGMIRREVLPDFFEALVNSIVGQQITTKAQQTIWRRMKEVLGDITPNKIVSMEEEELQGFGISYRKVRYIKSAAQKILSGELKVGALREMDDQQICDCLVKLDGVGVWTAQMLMIFSMERPDVLSYGDLAIQKGLRMIYHHRKITRELFHKYQRRYSPYGTVAGFYLWAVAGGAIEGLKDYAPKKK
ncbi:MULTISPECIES: DNA-3-methyladenine glycosylase family protein [Anaerostipes]|uniref:DNA-3-methyladenine glycosylase family protein n=1 Tax=Anaerostipes TaxID=207244 RepID=UPI00095248C4|nr:MULTISPECIES: DNA-3-methyladenine glycosylase [Anaerostipes]MCI5622329.1 DNA-3-methyladenine glycosylase [Anaerostipes sp.]MDY2725597.1 DNA-3-methyladenine glycosylase [Anaerostipes faecalis]OLR59874.1 DNA-3-methyladenine glycosidase [Anaerostipes sp. 494a]